MIVADFLVGRTTYGQCIEPEFVIPESACINENFGVLNNSPSGSFTYDWDFCAGDLAVAPQARQVLSNANFFRARSIRFIHAGAKWYAFSISATGNNVMRLDFGNDLQSTPVFYDMGNLGGALSGAFAFDMVEVEGTWHMFVANGGKNNILRLSFLDGLQDAPSVSVLETPSVFDNAGPNFVRVVKDSGFFYAFVSVGTAISNTRIVRLDLGSSIVNLSPETSVFSVAGSNQLRGLAFIKDCDLWTGFALSGNTNSLYRLSFNDGLSSPPVSSLLSTGTVSLNAPVNIELRKEGGVYYAFIQNARIEEANAALYRLSFGQSPQNNVVTADRIQTPLLTGGAYALDIVNDRSSWHAFTFNLATQSLLRFDFVNECSASTAVSSLQNPELVFYSAQGEYHVTLNITDVAGNTFSNSDTILVSSSLAPEIGFSYNNICALNDTRFSPSGNLQAVTEYHWDFGDGNESTTASPIHQFAGGGSYTVSLSALADNGCENFAKDTLQVYGMPVADFSTPPGTLCTNNGLSFSTTTPDIYDGNLSYQWYVDDMPVGADRDLQYTFTTTGTKDIKLVTSIPGCQSEITKTTSSVEAGPVVDFSFEGVCEDDPFSFHNLTTDPVTGYLWDFANGNTSTTTDAQQVFTDYGDYPVSLTATNAAGCENITTKTVKVHARPVAAFLADGPPNSCSGTPTRLVDQSITPNGDALTQWLWDFGDTSSDNIQTPTHIFSDAGRYNVSLTVTSAAGCSANVIQPVDIYQSPSTDFSFSPACDDLPVLFTPPADNSIVGWYWEIGTSYYTASSPTHTFKSPGNYPLYLEVTALNGCESSRHDVIAVPVALTPDFSYLKNCVGEEAVLTDVTTGSDPVKNRDWTFDSGETFSGSPVKFVFDKELVKTVTMKVTAASGCSYSVSKSITILPPPVAGFKPDPSSGAYPLEVAFTNTSSGATHYLWNFNDGTDAVSTEVSPVHTFEGAGSYNVELIASNNQECTSSFKASIATVAPLPDADIELISLTPNADGSSKLIVTIHNKGNTILRNLPLDLDFGGVLRLREVLANRINPGAKFNFVFSTGIVNPSDLQYICVSSDVPNDISPAGNRMCQGLGDALQAFHAYPNPASGSLNIEWVQSGTKNIRLSLVDTMGRILIDARQTASDGLNRRALDLSAVESGIYYLVIRQDDIVTIQKIAVSTHP